MLILSTHIIARLKFLIVFLEKTKQTFLTLIKRKIPKSFVLGHYVTKSNNPFVHIAHNPNILLYTFIQVINRKKKTFVVHIAQVQACLFVQYILTFLKKRV